MILNKGKNFKNLLLTKPCIGTFLKIPRFEVVDNLALAGFDFIICDMEHAQISESDAISVIRSAVANDLPVLVRLPDPKQGVVNRLLEAGATGIQIPRLRSIKDIYDLNNFMKYPPFGARSVGRANINAEYGRVKLTDYLENENNRVVTVGQFETKEIERPIENMFKNLDVAFIGPTDLGVDFGVPGKLDDPRIQERLNEIEECAKKSNTVLGAFAGSVKGAQKYIEKGYRYIAVSGDVSLLSKGAKALVDELKGNH